METSITAIIPRDKGYVCAACGGYVRADATVCKHCHCQLQPIEIAPETFAVIDTVWTRLTWALPAGVAAGLRVTLIVLGLSRYMEAVFGIPPYARIRSSFR